MLLLLKPDSLVLIQSQTMKQLNLVDGWEKNQSRKKIGHSSKYPLRTHFDCKWQKSNWNTLTQRVEFMAYLTRLKESQCISYSQKWLRTGIWKVLLILCIFILKFFLPIQTSYNWLANLVSLALAALRLLYIHFSYARVIAHHISVLGFQMS